MNVVLVLAVVAALILFIVGGLAESLEFLWLVGAIVLLATLVIFLSGIISRRPR